MGIDTGQKGGIAILQPHAPPLVAPLKNLKFLRDILLPFRALNPLIMVEITPVRPVFIKGRAVIPGKATTTFMLHQGSILGFLESYDLNHEIVSCKEWQPKVLGKIKKGETKVKAFEYVNLKWPELHLTPKDDGIVDALCIAAYASSCARHKNTGEVL